MTRLQYSGLDFDSANDDLLARLQARYASAFNDFAVSSQTLVLLDLESYGLDALGFYLDRRAAEVYLATARTRGAVARLTRQLGYKMRGASASVVDLPVAITDSSDSAITIPQGFLFRGPNDLIFELARSVTYQSNETGSAATKILPLFQGQRYGDTFVSDGTESQRFTIRRATSGQYLVSGSVTVTVNGSPWLEADTLSFGDRLEYEVGYNDDPPTITFGDGVVGAVPSAGATIVVTYRLCAGVAGRVTRDTIKEPVQPLVVNFRSVSLTITMPEGSSGGDDPESLAEARANAPRAWKAREVAVTRGDYEALATRFADPVAGRVAVAQAFVTRSADTDLALQDQLRTVRAAVVGPVAPTATALASLRSRWDSVRADTAVLEGALVALAGYGATLQADIAAITTATRQIQSVVAGVSATAASVTSAVAAARALLAGFTVVAPATPEQIHQTTLDALTARLDSILAGTALLGGVGATVSTQATAISTAAADATGQIADVGVDLSTSGSGLYDADQARQALLLLAGDPSTPSGGYLDCNAIDAAVVTGSVTAYAVVDGACVEIASHIGAILAADCKANLITVPILSRDSSGFYTDPSTSLIQALQVFLTERAELTQVVQVVSGGSYLLRAVLRLRIGVAQGYSLTLIQTGVSAAVDGVLRDRRFGASLYVSDVIRAVGRVDGVTFVNVTIEGYQSGASVLTDKLDASGNLIALPSDLVSKGSVAVSTEYQP